MTQDTMQRLAAVRAHAQSVRRSDFWVEYPASQPRISSFACDDPETHGTVSGNHLQNA